jgi:hypothetical protein
MRSIYCATIFVASGCAQVFGRQQEGTLPSVPETICGMISPSQAASRAHHGAAHGYLRAPTRQGGRVKIEDPFEVNADRCPYHTASLSLGHASLFVWRYVLYVFAFVLLERGTLLICAFLALNLAIEAALRCGS